MAPAGVQVNCLQNPGYKADGAKSYAKAITRWNINRSDMASFFIEGGKLMRRMGQTLGDEDNDHSSNSNSNSKSKSKLKADSDSETSSKRDMHSFAMSNPTRGALMIMNDRANNNGGGMHDPPKSRSKGGGTVMRDTAQVPAKDVENDSEYVVPVMIGNPGVKLNLDFDTGSSDLWVWSSHTHKNTKNRPIYHPGASRTSKKAKDLTWKIGYADGSDAHGVVYYDDIEVEGVKVKGQAIEAATDLSGSFLNDTSSDGLLGLAFPKLNTVKPRQQKTPFEQMIGQKLLDRPIFTVKLDKGDSAGFFTFGHVDGNVLRQGVDIWETYVIPDNGWWEFESRGIMIGKKEFPRPPGNTAIADTGTTLILIDDAMVHQLYSQIRGATLSHEDGGYILPSDSQPPDVYFACGNRYFGIPGSDLMFAPCGRKGYKFGAIQSRGGNKQDILGDVFLKRVYAVFDAGKGGPKIGFGQRDFTQN
ncbi:acid protease [Calocera viscosa TUFC12733]|uniref:Acid protease n=1 Tax=Calocera viscosa (strain TUFC12733) TaxID=1330018 RepID=A0A167PI52_CALVF|nr:acid protease [Calocera viscosa TUFC12733]